VDLFLTLARGAVQCSGSVPCGLTEAKEIAHSSDGMYLSTIYISVFRCNGCVIRAINGFPILIVLSMLKLGVHIT
jgi:hypothetical protein